MSIRDSYLFDTLCYLSLLSNVSMRLCFFPFLRAASCLSRDVDWPPFLPASPTVICPWLMIPPKRLACNKLYQAPKRLATLCQQDTSQPC